MAQIRFIVVATVLLFIFSCSSERKSTPVESGSGLTNLEDFNAFYMRFHRDTAYQAAHITFPLEGLPANADSLTFSSNDFKWNRSDWKYHQLLDDEEFTRNFLILNEKMVSESIRLKNSNLGLVRRFAKMDGDWYLIYYAGLNQVAEQ
ncbi:MAG: hypothetical protein R2879_08535 [Saprospiraceae bacterium]